MADQPATLDSIHRIVDLVTRERLPYAFIGGVALNAWAVPRATFNLDVAVAIEPTDVVDLLRRARREGFAVDAEFLAGFRDQVAGMEKVHLFLPAGTSLLAVDLFLAQTPFLQSVIERRVAVDLGRGPIHVCSAADLLLLKLLAGRPKDRTDVENLLAVQGVPEPDHLRAWAATLQVEERLRPHLGPDGEPGPAPT